MKTKKRCKIKYPRLLVFLITIIIAITIFYEWINSEIVHNFLTSLGYWWTFLWWLFYSYGFTSASATAILLIIAKGKSLVLSILIAWIWAFISDMIIFFFAKSSLMNEITILKEEWYIVKLRNFLKKTFWPRYIHIMPFVACLFIMSPLPTEIWVTILASKKDMSMKKFMIMSYILHTIGIAIILIIGRQI